MHVNLCNCKTENQNNFPHRNLIFEMWILNLYSIVDSIACCYFDMVNEFLISVMQYNYMQ